MASLPRNLDPAPIEQNYLLMLSRSTIRVEVRNGVGKRSPALIEYREYDSRRPR
jgi:hypothetical protein